jgi:hypothetical protein
MDAHHEEEDQTEGLAVANSVHLSVAHRESRLYRETWPSSRLITNDEAGHDDDRRADLLTAAGAERTAQLSRGSRN